MEAPKKLQLNQSTAQTIEYVIAKGLELQKKSIGSIATNTLKKEDIFSLQPHPQFA